MRDFKKFVQFAQEVKRGVAQAMPECEIVVPCIYLEDFFDRKMTIEETIKEIVDIFINRKTIKKNSFLEVINTSRNKKYLEEIPHRDFLDLSIVCRLKVSTGKDGMSSTVLSKGLIKHLGMTEEEVFSYAYENTKKIMPCLICDMAEILGFAIPMGIPIVTNKQKIFGAASVVFEDVLVSISQRVDGNYYLLPSSRHEMIVVPDPEGTSKPSELRQMVYEVNREQVANEDFLSDNIYYYDKEKGKLAIA